MGDDDKELIANQTVLELGSGTGAVGLYCARCLHAKRVVLTDLVPNMALLERNRALNQLASTVEIEPLDWTDRHGVARLQQYDYDWIFGSDLFLPFAANLLEPLALTIAELLRQRPNARALICYEERFDCSSFFVAADACGLCVVQVANQQLHPRYQDARRIHLLRIVLAQFDHEDTT